MPIRNTLAETEKELGSGIVSILWTMAQKTLGLSSTEGRRRENQYPWQDDICSCDASELQGYQRLARHHNLLVAEHEKLEHSCLLMQAYDPLLSYDPVIRLTSAASSFLVEEIERIQQRLLKTRLKLHSKEVLSSAVHNASSRASP